MSLLDPDSHSPKTDPDPEAIKLTKIFVFKPCTNLFKHAFVSAERVLEPRGVTLLFSSHEQSLLVWQILTRIRIRIRIRIFNHRPIEDVAHKCLQNCLSVAYVQYIEILVQF